MWITITQSKRQINTSQGQLLRFLQGICDSRTKKLTDRRGKIPLRKHINLENRQNFYLFFFVLTCKSLIHAIFWSFTFIFHKIPALVEFPAARQLLKVKSRPPGKFFELIPRGCPGGGVYPVGID